MTQPEPRPDPCPNPPPYPRPKIVAGAVLLVGVIAGYALMAWALWELVSS